MKKAAWIALSFVAPSIVALVFDASEALAGPPLLCHAIEIGEAQSLPWGSGTWQSDGINLNDDEFVAGTLALLSQDAATLTRMETIRRATIHAADRPRAAAALLSAVRSRVSGAKPPSASALFDLGYLCAAYEQMNIVSNHKDEGFGGGTRSELSVPADIRPYDLVGKSALMSPDDYAIEFALALMTWSTSLTAHTSHLERAIAGATEGTPLAQNLVARFGRAGQSMSDLRANYGMESDGERR